MAQNDNTRDEMLSQGLRITQLLLEAVDDPARLRAALHAMTVLLDADAGLFATGRRGDDDAHGFVVTTARDDWSGGSREVAFPGQVLFRRWGATRDAGLLQDLRALLHRHHIDAVLPADTDCVMAHFEVGPLVTGYVGFTRRTHGARLDPAKLAVVQSLLPQFATAYAITRRVESVRAVSAAAMNRFERYAIGVAIVDARGALQYCNDAARALFAAADGVRLDADGQIVAADDEGTAALRRSIAERLDGDLPDGHMAPTLLKLTRTEGRAPLSVAITPYRSGADPTLHGPHAGLAVVMIHNPDQPFSRMDEVIRNVYDLSAQEADLVCSLAAGESLEDIARHDQRSVDAVRSQLKRIFRKTGTAKQTELVKLVLAGPVAMVR